MDKNITFILRPPQASQTKIVAKQGWIYRY